MNSVIVAEFKALMGRDPPVEFLQRWASPLIVKQKTVIDLRKELLGTPGTRDKVVKTVATRFMTLTDASPERAFLEEALVRLTESGFDFAHIDSIIRSTPAFLAKYVGVVCELWRTLRESDPPGEAHQLAQQFVTNPRYDIEALRGDIMRFRVQAAASVVDRINEIEGGLFAVRLPDSQLTGEEIERQKVTSLIRAFDVQFGRLMTARELLRFLPSVRGVADIETFVWKERDLFDRAYERVKAVYEAYLELSIDINEFITKHIAVLDVQDTKEYMSKLREECMLDPRYKELMAQRISHEYHASYRMPIEEPDMNKIFDSLRSGGVEVTDGATVRSTIDTYVLQMEEYLSQVADIYHTHVGRTLEADEEADFKDKYRVGDVDLEAIVARVRRSYEYLDVVKGMVGKLCTDAGLLPSAAKVCRVAQQVMQAEDRSASAVQKTVNQMIMNKEI